MTPEVYDKRKLIILRAVLAVIGASVGYLALWQYFAYYPDVIRSEYQIVISVVTAALAALILALSAKPFYRLGASIASGIASVAVKMGVRGVVAVVLGFIAAGVFAVVFDVVIRRVLDIWAVRLLADILVYIVAACACCYGFTKWINTPKAEKTAPPPVGYLLAAECFKDARVEAAATTLINCKVLDGAYKALCLFGGDGAAEAVELLDRLISNGTVGVVKTAKDFADGTAYGELEKTVAGAKRLKPVRIDGGEGCVALSSFARPYKETNNTSEQSNPNSNSNEQSQAEIE